LCFQKRAQVRQRVQVLAGLAAAVVLALLLVALAVVVAQRIVVSLVLAEVRQADLAVVQD
jgi:hypothetical protein